MKRKSKFFLLLSALLVMLASCCVACERVAPNYAGVLMENYGKAGKEDFSIVTGRVNVSAPGTELFQVPLFDQRGEFEKPVHLKSADNTEFTARPTYSFRVIKSRAIDVVFDNKHIGSGENFVRSVSDNILEPRIYDLMKEESRKFKTDELMADGGSLKFEKGFEEIVTKEFSDRGLQLISFSAQLEFTESVKKRIDERNEVNTNLSVLDQQIMEQKKRNELAQLQAEELKIRSSGLTDRVLLEEFIQKWDGRTPLYGQETQILKVINN